MTDTQADTATMDPRDGPTEQFERHHDVVERSGNGGGKRVRWRLEGMLLCGFISPEQADAGRRFAIDYLKRIVGRGRSCLDITPSGGGGAGYHFEERRYAAWAYEKARVAVETTDHPKRLAGRQRRSCGNAA